MDYNAHTLSACVQVSSTFIVAAVLPALCGTVQAADHPRLLSRTLACVREVTAVMVVSRCGPRDGCRYLLHHM